MGRKTIDIRIGRQLFFDDELIAETNLIRRFYYPKVLQKPVLKPETKLELDEGFCPCAAPFPGGVYYNDIEKQYQMWYQAGWMRGSGYAVSDDGYNWTRVKDAVIPFDNYQFRDSEKICIDYNAPES